jgi:hypothetical protein
LSAFFRRCCNKSFFKYNDNTHYACEEIKEIAMEYHNFWLPVIKRRLRKYNFLGGPGIDCNFVRDPEQRELNDL